MRTLVGSTSSGVAAAVTLPGYLIQIAYATTLRLSTRGTLTWNSQTWTAADARVSGLAVDSSRSSLAGELVLGNTDLTYGAQVLSEGVAGRAVIVWAFYGAAPALADPVKVFEGVANEASIAEDGDVRISLQQASSTTLFCPRTYLTAASGFSFLPAVGQIVTWNGETVKLTPEGI
jgi:hypothetical protein